MTVTAESTFEEIPLEDIALPAWLEESIPEVRTPVMLQKDGERFYGVFPDERETGRFTSIEDALDFIEGKDDGRGVEFSAEFTEEEQSESRVFTRRGRFRWLRPDSHRLMFLRVKLRDAKYRHEAYVADPENIYLAYTFIVRHPALWVKQYHRYDTDPATPLWDWEADNARSLYFAPITATNGNVLWGLEGGAHVEPDYTSRYHDVRLDTYADTMEGAYIGFAKKLNQYFDWNGEERPDAPDWLNNDD